MAKSYSDPVKQKSRGKLQEFIVKHFGTNLKNLRVLCFPGAEQEGEVGLELKVYDALGIPRKNITGLEIDKRRAERLKKANLGISVVHCSDIDYLQTAKSRGRRWHIISLDYTGFFSQGKRYALELIAGDALLTNRGVLATNFLAQRENVESQDHLLRAKYLGELAHTENPFEDAIDPDLGLQHSLDFLNSFQGRPNNTAISDVRSTSISSVIASTFSVSRILFTYDLLKDEPWAKWFVDCWSNPEGWSEETHKFAEDLVKKNLARSKEEAIFRRSQMQVILFHYIQKKVGASHKPLAGFAYARLNDPYLLEDHEAYSYVSNSGRPMFFDLFYFTKRTSEFERLSKVLEYDAKTDSFLMLSGIKSHHKKKRLLKSALDLEKEVTLYQLDTQKAFLQNLDRVSLGSSYIPPKKKEKLGKEDALFLLKNGVPIGEILQTYSGIKEHQLRAYKAHMTMGTYDKKE